MPAVLTREQTPGRASGTAGGAQGTHSPHRVLFSRGLNQGALPAEREAAAQAHGLTPEGVKPNEGFKRVTSPPNFKTSCTEVVRGPQQEASTCGTSILL